MGTTPTAEGPACARVAAPRTPSIRNNPPRDDFGASSARARNSPALVPSRGVACPFPNLASTPGRPGTQCRVSVSGWGHPRPVKRPKVVRIYGATTLEEAPGSPKTPRPRQFPPYRRVAPAVPMPAAQRRRRPACRPSATPSFAACWAEAAAGSAPPQPSRPRALTGSCAACSAGRTSSRALAAGCARAAALDAATWDRRKYTLPPRVASARLGPAERARWRLQVPTVRRQAPGVLGRLCRSAALGLWLPRLGSLTHTRALLDLNRPQNT